MRTALGAIATTWPVEIEAYRVRLEPIASGRSGFASHLNLHWDAADCEQVLSEMPPGATRRKQLTT